MDIALEVDDVRGAYEEAMRRGAASVSPPTALEDTNGVYETATIRAYGDTTHSFVNRDRYRGVFAPGYKPIDPERYSPTTFHPTGLAAIDHIVGNVEEGKMNEWVKFYEKVLGFNQLIQLRRQGHQHRVFRTHVQGGAERHRPDQVPDQRAGQGQTPIADRRVPAVLRRPRRAAHRHGHRRHRRNRPRHARSTTSRSSRCRTSYYEMLPDRIGTIKEDLEELAELGILVDRDDEGYMLQIFTKPVADRPTLFFEVIQRRGSQSFGKGNFKALFEAIEREQARRGTL